MRAFVVFVLGFVGIFGLGCEEGSNPDTCLQLANVCSDAQYGQARCVVGENEVETCGLDDEGACLVWSLSETCGDDSICVDGKCERNCDEVCLLGQSECVMTQIRVCAVGTDGCPAWQQGEDCGVTDRLCDDTSEPAACIDDCSQVCSPGASRCSDSVIETCVTGLDDCNSWQAGEDCADGGQFCVLSNGTASCVEDCGAQCSLGTRRCRGGVVEACVAQAEACNDWQVAENCVAEGKVCIESEGAAVCALDCSNQCEQDSTRCAGDVIESCVAQVELCNAWQAGLDCAEQGELCVEADGGAICEATAEARLILSEYVEGSSYNKALEITNTGNNSVADLSRCRLERYNNGSVDVSATYTFPELPLAAGGVFVLCSSQISVSAFEQICTDLAALGLAEAHGFCGLFNGNDAILLYCDDVLQDSFGRLGEDPGTAWGTEPIISVNHSLRRIDGISSGDLIPDDVFEPADEYEDLGYDYFDNLGIR